MLIDLVLAGGLLWGQSWARGLAVARMVLGLLGVGAASIEFGVYSLLLVQAAMSVSVLLLVIGPGTRSSIALALGLFVVPFTIGGALLIDAS